MTSKEALKRIKKSHYVAMDCMGIEEPDVETEEAIKTIEKDLEVLDILKRWVLVNETYDDLFPYEIKLRNGYVSNKSCLVFTKDDYEKVKEWLENE